MSRFTSRQDGDSLIATCRARAVRLLKRNLTDAGILAATPGARADRRGYAAIFGRDAAICAVGMALSGDAELERGAQAAIHTLAAHQARNGQIAKFVDVRRREADFWYLGCIDSTLWWLIALALLDRASARRRSGRKPQNVPPRTTAGVGPLQRRYAARIAHAIEWLRAQEHQRFYLLQQNEASDWADIMPRSGFVLYTNALWHVVKRLYRLRGVRETYDNFNGLFHPFSAGMAEYRRARLLRNYVLRQARDRDLYLSFVNFSFFGEEGDVFGNVLAVLAGLADERATRRTLDALEHTLVRDSYPGRSVLRPIRESSLMWRAYMARHGQNRVYQYHNGGIWPMVGGFWVAALASSGRRVRARLELIKLARACQLGDWAFAEWLHGKTSRPRGMPGQSWNAAAFLMASHALETGRNPLQPFR